MSAQIELINWYNRNSKCRSTEVFDLIAHNTVEATMMCSCDSFVVSEFDYNRK